MAVLKKINRLYLNKNEGKEEDAEEIHFESATLCAGELCLWINIHIVFVLCLHVLRANRRTWVAWHMCDYWKKY